MLHRLHALTPTSGRAVVLLPYAALPHATRDHRRLDEALASLPITLVCLCPQDADRLTVESFRRDHAHLLAASSPASGPFMIELAIERLADLYGLRAGLRRMALDLGLTGTRGERAVLAAHEAAVLAHRLTRANTGEPPPGRCVLRAYGADGEMSVDIDLPHSARFPPELWDDDPLKEIRAFCRGASWSGSLATRRIQVRL